ncbi:protein FMC1 homolog [Petromyzon marinus]|uniref:Protein FMC1 homolog n=1 Tax=Petromyzon marinus TaxID=7757 RepID=A0AAJ7TUI3_PETMA|nr:protein FMC1 homolog [Petromyzon marinus]
MEAARVLRALLRELRLASPPERRLRDGLAYRHVAQLFRDNQVTEEQKCRAREEMQHRAITYLCLLRSTRQYAALHSEYQGRGERAPEDVARLVGLCMPPRQRQAPHGEGGGGGIGGGDEGPR